MSWRCSFRRRRFLPYLEGEVSRREAMRLEKHLAGCRKCGEFFTRVRIGHQAGRQFGRIGPGIEGRPPEFAELWKGKETKPGGPERLARDARATLRGRRLAPAATALITLAAAAFIAVAVFNPGILRRADGPSAVSPATIGYAGFIPVRIREFASHNRSPVVTEGFVREVYFDEQEKTLHIKLVEIPQKSEPFVICEIRSPGSMAIPPEGSRIRVYGMARYDAQPGRQWHEVNPVMTLAVLNR